ncbi:DUF2059 domain-containing protein [Piscinibacter sakaiensis]|uniref:DUF2059 domain-containing protein n=1 Tax=Piscinibacter sakaiensis TaxID=1547922 RepID=A0A0K8P5N2_PISS1|nr:DUF2059 domain-containing protein [Piscinibacter sakaiensis]GAP38023.1 hypothetical protein ISF6_4217 [Piscinibacter sakaiensis]
MKHWLAALFLLTALSARAEPPSDASITALMTVTKMEALVGSLGTQLEQTIRLGMETAARDKPLTADQRKFLEIAPARLALAFREEFTWARLQPVYAQIYRDSFDQAEIDGMLAFYATPAGRATIDKMPVVIQQSMLATQRLMQTAMPRVQAAMHEALREAGLPVPQ